MTTTIMHQGFADDRFFWINLWTHVVQAAVFVGLPVLAVSARMAWVSRRARNASSPTLTGRSVVASAAGTAVGVLAGLVCVWSGRALLAPVAVAVGYLGGIVAGELVRVSRPTGATRVASLGTRRATAYLPRWTVAVACAAAVMTISAPAVLTLLPTVRYGPWHPVPLDRTLTLPGQTQGWPPADTTVTMAVIAAAALLAGGLIARRIALLPSAALDGDSAERARFAIARTVAGAVAGIELLLLAALAVTLSITLAVPTQVGGLDYATSRMLVWTGVILAAAGVAIWAIAAASGHGRLTGPAAHPSTP